MESDQSDQSVNVGVNRGIISTGDYADNRIVNLGDVRPPESVTLSGFLTNVRLAADDQFFGRDAEMLEIGKVLTGEAHAVVVAGEAGIGKTELARQYILRNSGQYQLIWWIDAAGSSAVDRSLAELAARLEPRLAQAPDTAVQWIHSWLTTHDRWLIVADGAQGVSILGGLLPVSQHGQVLVTSRQAEGWRTRCQVLELGTLDPRSAARLMASLARGEAHEEDPDTAALCARLGYLPTPIANVARQLARTGTGPAQYLKALPDLPVFSSAGSQARQMADVITSLHSLQRILKDIQATPERRDSDLGARIRDLLSADVVARHLDAAYLSDHWGFVEVALKAYRVDPKARSALRLEISRLASKKAAADAERTATATMAARLEERQRPRSPAPPPRARPAKVISDALTTFSAFLLLAAVSVVIGTVVAEWRSVHHLGIGDWIAAAVSVIAVGMLIVYVWQEAMWRLGSVTAVPILGAPAAFGWFLARQTSVMTIGTLKIAFSHIGMAVGPWLVWRF